MSQRFTYIVLSFLLMLPLGAENRQDIMADFKPVSDSLKILLHERTSVDSELTLRKVMKRSGNLDFYFDQSLGDYPWREEDCRWFTKTLKSLYPEAYRRYGLGVVYCKREKLQALSTNKLGFNGHPDSFKYGIKDTRGTSFPFIEEIGRPYFSKGLSERNIALWSSHGRYYNQNEDRWMWQRPCLFQTVEDLFSTSFVIDYLTPMLENAGAYVMMPRERDANPVELIIDNDPYGSDRGTGSYQESGAWSDAGSGFADSKQQYVGHDNPFRLGTARFVGCVDSRKDRKFAVASWTAEVPHRDKYAVYISYKSLKNSSESAVYTVHHAGGSSSFTVNQKMGGGTWIYLGSFDFTPDKALRIELENTVAAGRKFVPGSVVCADAVKIGGGMGNIARSVQDDSLSVAKISALPRYAESARYWMQWAGMDSTIYSQHELKDDYRDDLFSRGDWVDYLSGGSRFQPKKEGLNIPIDLTFAFHSDAGVTPNDSTIGTLMIYTRINEWAKSFPCGEDRITSREFADLVQTQVVTDLRHSVDSSWNRRQIWDRAYRESRTPPTPTILFESLSHQNFADMRYGLDPVFKFTVSRAIYKGMLKYLSNRYSCPYVVQPLPPRAFSARLEGKKVKLSWREREDKLEPTAFAREFMLYTRVDDGAFDKGRKIKFTKDADGRYSTVCQAEAGHIYSYRLTALNEGGESFPSEILSVGIVSPENCFEEGSAQETESNTVLIVNNFTRVSAPAWFDTPLYAGFDNNTDAGVAYLRDISFAGEMYEMHRDKEWRSNDNPGFGASYSDQAGKIVAGNSFDYPYLHGREIMDAGYSFCSSSAEAFYEYDRQKAPGASADMKDNKLSDTYFAIDIICGRQVTTPLGKAGGEQRFSVFPLEMQNAIKQYTEKGGNILISGSYIGTDVWDNIYPIVCDSTFRQTSIEFAEKQLGYKWNGNHASEHKNADVLVPASKHSESIYKYPAGLSGGVIYSSEKGYKVISYGFPIEALADKEEFTKIIHSSLKHFKP